MDDVLSYLNSATLRGLLAIGLGVFVLLLPELTLSLLETTLVIAAVGSGCIDLWYYLTGRAWRHTPSSRITALVRGLVSIAFALVLFVVPRTARPAGQCRRPLPCAARVDRIAASAGAAVCADPRDRPSVGRGPVRDPGERRVLPPPVS